MHDTYLRVPSRFLLDLDRVRCVFDSMFGAGGQLRATQSKTVRSDYPAINVRHSPQAVDVHVFAPGIDASRAEVTIDQGVLTIAGERASDLPPDPAKISVHGRERYSGKFRRAVSLPDDIDPNQVRATYRDGVLHVHLCRRDAVQPRRIAVE